MGIVFSDLAVSADGYATGLNQREEAPFGDIDQDWLHSWMFDTYEENRAEGDKDMRATEASYVARGHRERVLQVEQALAKLGAVEVRDFGPGATIESSALVELESGKRRALYFLLPAAGGERMQFQGVELQTLATTSPLGASLLGLSEDDEAEVVTPQGTRTYLITSVR